MYIYIVLRKYDAYVALASSDVCVMHVHTSERVSYIYVCVYIYIHIYIHILTYTLRCAPIGIMRETRIP